MKEIVIETPRMSLYYHPAEKLIHHEMHAYPGFELLERVLCKGLELMKKHGASKWLSDDRLGGALPQSHHEWGENVWAPQAVSLGWKRWALVLPENTLHASNMNRLSERYAALGVTVEHFSDPARAFLWLKKDIVSPSLDARRT
jgi:hypothetical protein